MRKAEGEFGREVVGMGIQAMVSGVIRRGGEGRRRRAEGGEGRSGLEIAEVLADEDGVAGADRDGVFQVSAEGEDGGAAGFMWMGSGA